MGTPATKRTAKLVLAKARRKLRTRVGPTLDPEASAPRIDWLVHARTLLLASLVFGGALSVLHYVYSEGASLGKYAKDVEATLHAHESAVEAIARDTAFLQRQVYGLSKLSANDQQADAQRIMEVSQQPYNVCLYAGDSLVFWTNNRTFLPEGTRPSRLAKSQMRTLKNGRYLIRRTRTTLFKGRNYDLVGLIPVKNAYTLPSEYLRNTFVGNDHIPEAVSLSQVPTAFPVRTLDGEVATYLQGTRPFYDGDFQRASLLLYVLGLLFLGFWLNRVADNVERAYGPWWGGATMLGAVLVLRGSMRWAGFSERFAELGTFSELFTLRVMSGTLGGFVFNTLIALWLISFFHRHYRISPQETHTDLRRWLATSAHYAAIVFGAYGLTHAFQAVMTDSDLVFDFRNVLNLGGYSMVAVLAMLTLMFGLFLFAHRLMLGIGEIGLSTKARATALLGAMALVTPLLLGVSSPLPVPHFLVGTLMFVMVYDIFVDSGESDVLWLFFWLVVLSIYSAALLFTFNEQKDLGRRVEYARVLSEPRDTIAEQGLRSFVGALRGSIAFQKILSSTEAVTPIREVTPLFERMLIDEGYLYNNYSYRVYGYDEARDSTFLEGRAAQEAQAAMQRYEGAAVIDEHIRYSVLDERPVKYLVRLQTDLDREPTRHLLIELAHESRSPSRVFTELLVDERYKHLQALPEYDYAIYRRGKLIEEQGRTHALELRIPNLPQPGEIISETDAQHSSVLYAGNDDTLVLIGKDMGGYWRPMSLFSYLFVWCIMLTLVMSLLNTYVDFLPRAIDITWLGKPDLKTKIQVGIVALVLLSFAMIGYVTVLYFHDSTDAYHDNRLNRKVASILRNTEHEIQLLSEITELDPASIGRIIKPISEIHHMDVNLYDRNGDLLSSSETDIFKRGVIAPKMGAYAYQMMEKRGRSQIVQVESVGSLTYRAAYVPVRMAEGEPIAYMGLPYYSKQRDLRDDVSSFMGTLLNVYVFLLLIAGVIAITVANSITQPLSELGAKIRRFKIDNKNEPLEWKARDELGALIGEFNTMLSTVEESAKELDNARREKAWREMAQQVAHEIKNPLTPMKLSIQYLRHAYDRNPDPEQIEPLINRVSGTLIEQIDNLATIATTFSTFARMPEPQNSHFDLDELVQSVYDLFLDEDVDSTIHIAPDEDYGVHADKKLLMRVLNNLIKNAIQAIPEERRGAITVELDVRDGLAVVAVGDNGTGIPADMQEKVFFPKFTTKSSGTGLGLAICRDIVKAAGGRIYFETQEGSGTVFFVEIPLAGGAHADQLADDGAEVAGARD